MWRPRIQVQRCVPRNWSDAPPVPTSPLLEPASSNAPSSLCGRELTFDSAAALPRTPPPGQDGKPGRGEQENRSVLAGVVGLEALLGTFHRWAAFKAARKSQGGV